ncbi:putative sugar transporter [Wilcoxina mikolae CBS 423.85]|nr:putative sugar transporter [Wilcoxina mikolae CBS 423.85]
MSSQTKPEEATFETTKTADEFTPSAPRRARPLAVIPDEAWGLFCVAGFGWCLDNLWPQVTAIILPSVILELHPPRREYLSLAQNREPPELRIISAADRASGSHDWRGRLGIGSDIIGRRWAFNLTLLITGVFGTIAGASSSFSVIAVMTALWSVGVGGNLPVDSAVFLEFLPGSHQYLLTVMSVWWSAGQVVVSAIAWPLMGNFSCSSKGECRREENMGWRCLLFAMGGFTLVMFILRFFVFDLYESPKLLAGRGNDIATSRVVEKLALYNGSPTTFSLSDLQTIDSTAESTGKYTSTSAVVKRNLSKFSGSHINTSIIILLWFMIGLAFPLYNAFLPYFLSRHGAKTNTSTSTTLRNYLIYGIMNIPGSLLGGTAIEIPRIGRKGAMCVATVFTGVFIFCGTTARTSNAQLGWNCGYAVTSNMMYSILYAYTPEVFPTKDRGTGNGLAATANRIGGILAPVIAMYANLATLVPIYIAGSLYLVAAGIMLLLPYESRGKSSL